MFFKNYNRKELEQKIASEEKGVADYEKLLEDIKNNYLPLRDKCVKVIYDNEMNYYPLRDVVGAAYEDGKLRLIINMVKTDTWDAKPTVKIVGTLVDETIQLRCFNRESPVAELILKLEDPTKVIERVIGYIKNRISNYKAKLNELK